jgi:hypothetical protein
MPETGRLAPLKPIMLVRPPLGILNEASFWDELEAAGIEEVAIGWLALLDGADAATMWPRPEDRNPRALAAVGGKPVRATAVGAFRPNKALYEGLSILPPEMPPHLAEESKRLKTSIKEARRRGFRLWVANDAGYFSAGTIGGSARPSQARPIVDPEMVAYVAARSKDVSANFPEFEGLLQDGPDFKWEIKPGHRDDMFLEEFDFPEYRDIAAGIGLTIERVIDGRDAFKRRLQTLSPAAVDDFLANRRGLFGSYDWWNEQPSTLAWMRFKAAAIERHLVALRAALREALPGWKLFMSSRLPTLAPLTGHNLRRKRGYCDYQMPKEYWWSGGVAGYRGTMTNWVETLVEWNPGLSEEKAAEWLSAAFDVPVTPKYPVRDYRSEPPDEWFVTTVRDQTRKMIASVGGPDRFVPWVGLEHFGSDWMTAGEVRRLLEEMQAQGTTRYAYYVYNSITPEIWKVISSFSNKLK